MRNQAAGQQAQADALAAAAAEQRKQQALQEQLVATRVAERLRQAQDSHQAELNATTGEHTRQLSAAQAEHAVQLREAHTELKQAKDALKEVLYLTLMMIKQTVLQACCLYVAAPVCCSCLVQH